MRDLLTWIKRVARPGRHARSIFHKPRHRAGWREVTLARQQAYDGLLASLDDLLALQTR